MCPWSFSTLHFPGCLLYRGSSLHILSPFPQRQTVPVIVTWCWPDWGGCGGVAVGLSAVPLQPQPGASTGLSVLEMGFSPGPCPSLPFRVVIDFFLFLPSQYGFHSLCPWGHGVATLPPCLHAFPRVRSPPSSNHGGWFSLVSHPAPHLL